MAMITHTEIISGLLGVAGLAVLGCGFLAGREYPARRVLDDSYREGRLDERAVWLDDEAAGAEAAEVPGVRRPDLDGPHVGESADAGHGAGPRHSGLAADDMGPDAPRLRDTRELADAAPAPPGEAAPWEPAPGDLIVRQAAILAPEAEQRAAQRREHEPPGPDAGVSTFPPVPIAACAAGDGPVKAGPSGPGAEHCEVLGMLGDTQAFRLIRWEFQRQRELASAPWAPLPAWTERRAA